MNRIIYLPELNLALFSFVFHFVWEFLQVPTYAGMAEMEHWPATLICTQATIGDVGFALSAYWATALASRSRFWFQAPRPWQIGLFLAIGILLTIGFEWYYINISGFLVYSYLMPLVPPFGTGLSPLVQWVIVPLLVLLVMQRQLSPLPMQPTGAR